MIQSSISQKQIKSKYFQAHESTAKKQMKQQWKGWFEKVHFSIFLTKSPSSDIDGNCAHRFWKCSNWATFCLYLVLSIWRFFHYLLFFKISFHKWQKTVTLPLLGCSQLISIWSPLQLLVKHCKNTVTQTKCFLNHKWQKLLRRTYQVSMQIFFHSLQLQFLFWLDWDDRINIKTHY